MFDPQTVISAILLTTWVVALGASFGSFLNVVVWRMPRGVSVSDSRSHCPKCEASILARDNIPVIGWLRLRGKCRNCQLPISTRYPLVEGAVGLVWGLLLLLEVVGHGMNLPVEWSARHLYIWMIEFPNCVLLYVFFNHIVLIYFVFGITLIDLDKFRTPLKLSLFALATGCGIILLWPFSIPLSPVDVNQLSEAYSDSRLMQSLLKIATGLGAGMLVGLLLSPFDDRTSLTKLSRSATLVIGILIGVYLGWQAVCSVGLLAGVIWCLLKLLPMKILPKSFPIAGGLVIHIFAWRWLDQIPNWPGQSTQFYLVAIILVLSFLIQLIVERITRPKLKTAE